MPMGPAPNALRDYSRAFNARLLAEVGADFGPIDWSWAQWLLRPAPMPKDSCLSWHVRALDSYVCLSWRPPISKLLRGALGSAVANYFCKALRAT